ncbi:hypothetical protein T492DRAFT_879522 [Pavlovales sp. CCMP2436]|nr:hypothetical protein T492DRAFT_879522 [Pavlovales sp. CCMP2436]
MADGTLIIFGANEHGQLGETEAEAEKQPFKHRAVKLPHDEFAIAAAAGEGHSLVLAAR